MQRINNFKDPNENAGLWEQHEKMKAWNIGIGEGEESQDKDLDEIFSNIIEEKFLKLRQAHPYR